MGRGGCCSITTTKRRRRPRPLERPQAGNRQRLPRGGQPMHDELTARQRAVSLRLAGRSVNFICVALGRVEAWFYKWWHRYLEDRPEGLYDLTRANHHVAQRIPP